MSWKDHGTLRLYKSSVVINTKVKLLVQAVRLLSMNKVYPSRASSRFQWSLAMNWNEICLLFLFILQHWSIIPTIQMRFIADPYKFNTCSYIRYRSLPVGPQVLPFLFQIHIVFHTHLSHFPVCLTPTVYICFEILAIPNSIYLMFSANWLNGSVEWWICLINILQRSSLFTTSCP